VSALGVAGRIRMARLYGVGGETWTVTTPASGLGGSPTSAPSITGKALQGRLGREGQSAPGLAVATIAWYFVLFSGTLTAKQQLTDGSYTFAVVGRVAPNVYEVTRL
jgi:hypothetical protein